MAEVVSQRIGNELTRLYAVMNEVANRAVVTCDDIQYFINCLEHEKKKKRKCKLATVTG